MLNGLVARIRSGRRSGWEALPLGVFVLISFLAHLLLIIVGVRLVTPARATPSLSEFVAVDLVEIEPRAATDRTRDAPSPKAAAPAPEWRPDKVEQAQAQPVQTTESEVRDGKKSTVELDTEFPFNYYLTIVRNKISSNWLPPGSHAGRGTVRTRLHFVILRDGQVNRVVVEETSGVSFFDQSALRAIYASAPLPPLPEEFPDAELGVHFSFEFIP
ncbi:MAG: TonB C-terminal domain-containing protein [Candidatus Eisenbacteria bacterium]|jgi:TonB family protein|nr:TonB C-terminal domain-containing protein [Candidatus Eisenbacteria bacterium]